MIIYATKETIERNKLKIPNALNLPVKEMTQIIIALCPHNNSLCKCLLQVCYILTLILIIHNK
jgi:hypothetical protein